MDVQTVSRPRYYLIVLAVAVLVTAIPMPAQAQSGTCPDTTNQVTTPGGWYPSGSATCVDDTAFTVDALYSPDAPCGVVFMVDDNIDAAFEDEWPHMVVAPPAGFAFPSGAARIMFIFEPFSRVGMFNTVTPFLNEVNFEVRSYYPTGQLISSSLVSTTSFTQKWRTVDPDDIYYVPETMYYEMSFTTPMVSDGYVDIHIIEPEPPGIWGGSDYLEKYFLSSFRLGDTASGVPSLCDVPGAATPTPPPTATMTPVPTVTGTATATTTGTPPATATPSTTPTGTLPPSPSPTFWPTAPGGTMTPLPSLTPMNNPTMEVATPTPIGEVPTLPAIQLPSLDLQTDYSTPFPFSVALTPNATAQARLNDISTRTAGGMIIVTRWYTSTNAALDVLTLDITSTTGISTPLQIATTITENISEPIRYVKSLRWMMPHSWIFVLSLILMTVWIFFILFVKFAIAVASDGATAMRRVWDIVVQIIELFTP